jgi:hypothetical protein
LNGQTGHIEERRKGKLRIRIFTRRNSIINKPVADNLTHYGVYRRKIYSRAGRSD